MVEQTVQNAIKKAFAALTGQLEDAALIACDGQSAQSVDEARRCHDDLISALERMLVRLHALKGSIR